MVAQSGGYYGEPFKVFLGVTQGDPLSPTIFNVVVETVFRHWVTMVAAMEEAGDPGAAVTEAFGRDVKWLEAYFNADDGILVSAQSTQLQWAFENLTELFECVDLHINVTKKVSMAYHP